MGNQEKWQLVWLAFSVVFLALNISIGGWLVLTIVWILLIITRIGLYFSYRKTRLDNPRNG